MRKYGGKEPKECPSCGVLTLRWQTRNRRWRCASAGCAHIVDEATSYSNTRSNARAVTTVESQQLTFALTADALSEQSDNHGRFTGVYRVFLVGKQLD